VEEERPSSKEAVAYSFMAIYTGEMITDILKLEGGGKSLSRHCEEEKGDKNRGGGA